jgi:hypothetical protein
MPSNLIDQNDIFHLANQFSSARPILFTGAGFSLDSKNITGNKCPAYSDIRNEIWQLCFGNTKISDEVQLQDLYDVALQRHKTKLKDYLLSVLTIEAESLPKWYNDILSFPWQRCYTLNIDNIEQAIARKFKLIRQPKSISAIKDALPSEGIISYSQELLFIHLNGTLQDVPKLTTFSLTQYYDRLNQKDPWYVTLATDLMCHPIVFIGTKLNEPPLWQHIELRRKKGVRGAQELRPRSYLVIPDLNPARKARLSQFNVIHIPMTGKEFCELLLEKIGDSLLKGSMLIQGRDQKIGHQIALPLVSDLAVNLITKTDYLLGSFPHWADIHCGRAIARATDDDIWHIAQERIRLQDIKGIIALTGTAGSGKSTSLMRLALHLSRNGAKVAWIDADTEVSPWELREKMREPNAPEILIIDDADTYGRQLMATLREIAQKEPFPLIAVAIRSNRIDRFVNSRQLISIPYSENSMPPLTDSDISALINILDQENRLGRLKGWSRERQEQAFREQCGRILIVAMLQATSGKPFEEKLIEEYGELDETAKRIYSLLILTTHFRFALTTEDILIALQQNTNEALNALDMLARRHLVVIDIVSKSFKVLHKYIADTLFDKMGKSFDMYYNIISLGVLCAVRISPNMASGAKPRRLLRLIINHEFLIRILGIEFARNVYGELENYLTLTNDSHFWLQRGAMEVEEGNLDHAENFLNQSKAINPNSSLLENEFAYLLFKKANQLPTAAHAVELANEAVRSLIGSIAKYGDSDPYPFHILGSQGLAWARRGIFAKDKKREFLEKLYKLIDDGQNRHPRNNQISTLCKELQREYLSLAIS